MSTQWWEPGTITYSMPEQPELLRHKPWRFMRAETRCPDCGTLLTVTASVDMEVIAAEGSRAADHYRIQITDAVFSAARQHVCPTPEEDR